MHKDQKSHKLLLNKLVFSLIYSKTCFFITIEESNTSASKDRRIALEKVGLVNNFVKVFWFTKYICMHFKISNLPLFVILKQEKAGNIQMTFWW